MNSDESNIHALVAYHLHLILQPQKLDHLIPATTAVLAKQARREAIDPDTSAGRDRLSQLSVEAGMVIRSVNGLLMAAGVRPEVDAMVCIHGVVAGIYVALPSAHHPNRERDRIRILIRILRSLRALRVARAAYSITVQLVSQMKLHDKVDPRLVVTLTTVEAVLGGLRLQMPLDRTRLRTMIVRNLRRATGSQP